MRLNVKALAIAGAVFAAFGLFSIAILNLAFPAYGAGFLEIWASIYPGYDGPDGFLSVIVVCLYGSLDGAFTGAVVAWLYNVITRRTSRNAATTGAVM